jgi:hypothetical protein
MKLIHLLAVTGAIATGSLALARTSPSSAPESKPRVPPPDATNRTMGVTDSDWRCSPPPGVSFMTGGVGRVTAPLQEKMTLADQSTREGASR